MTPHMDATVLTQVFFFHLFSIWSLLSTPGPTLKTKEAIVGYIFQLLVLAMSQGSPTGNLGTTWSSLSA